MNFKEYEETIKDKPYTETLEYSQAIMWLHPEILPLGGGFNRRRMKYTDLHFKQIPTTYKAIKVELFYSGSSAIRSLMRCFSYETGSYKYINQVFVTANLLERISCLVYKGKDGRYKKLSKERYKYEIFEGRAETVEEVYEKTKYAGRTENP